MCLIAGIMLKNISVRESHAIVIRNLGRLTFSRKTLSNWILQSKEFNLENLKTASAITHKRHGSKQEIHGGNHGELGASKFTGKYA